MNLQLDVKLKESMKGYLNTFFRSLQGDLSSRRSFASTLSAFHNTVKAHHDKLQADTLLAVQGFASVIDSVTSSVLELEMENEKLVTETTEDILKILGGKMGKLTLSDAKGQKSSSLDQDSHFPTYIRPSYEWLLSNLHNPYPSKDVKKSIARRSKCSVKDVDSWFIDARKRIGWNALRKRKFANKQGSIIAAAIRFFKPSLESFTDDLRATLISETDANNVYDADFTAMENAARCLYSGRFVDVVSDLPSRRTPSLTLSQTPEDDGRKAGPLSLLSPNAGTRCQTEALPSLRLDPTLSYPTPEPSPEHSAVEDSSPAFVSLSLPSLPDGTRSRKRRQSIVEPSEGFDSGSEEIPIRSRKKSRPDAWQSANDAAEFAQPSLPSQIPSVGPAEGLSEVSDQITVQTKSSSSADSSTKRKRRLSDGDNQRPAKRPHNALAVPRLQVVSDPFPFARPATDDPFNNWFNGNFSDCLLSDVIPSPIGLEVQSLPDNVQLEIDCHNYDVSPPEPTIALPGAPSLVHSHALSSLSEVQIPEILDASSYENMSTSNTQPDPHVFDIVDNGDFSLPLDFNFPSVEGVVPQDLAFDPLDQIINFGTLRQTPPLNFNWMQQPLSDAVDLVEPLEPHIPEIAGLPHFNPETHQDLVFPEDHDAKRLRLQFLREELKLLESELEF